jgi:hypothetical protein
MTTTTTTLMPLDPAVSPQRVARVLTISANLLPEEIVASRRARRSRTWVLIALALVILLLAGWYLQANHDRSNATKELDDVTSQTAATQRNQNKYSEVVEVRNETDTLTKELKTLLVGDLPYSTLLKTLRTTGTAAGVTIIGVTATLNSIEAGTGAPAAALPSDSSAATIGTLVITGSGPDKPSVAAYADKLDALKTVANPYVTSVVTSKSDGVTFSLTADITSSASCGRFTNECKSTGGN